MSDIPVYPSASDLTADDGPSYDEPIGAPAIGGEGVGSFGRPAGDPALEARVTELQGRVETLTERLDSLTHPLPKEFGGRKVSLFDGTPEVVATTKQSMMIGVVIGIVVCVFIFAIYLTVVHL